MTEEQMKNWIDNATYEQLLKRWRFAPVGDPLFASKMGDYFAEVLAERKKQVGNAEHIRASKCIGWKRDQCLSL